MDTCYYSEFLMVDSNELFLVGWSGIVIMSRDLKGKIGQRERRLNRRVKRVPQKNCRGKIGFREGTMEREK